MELFRFLIANISKTGSFSMNLSQFNIWAIRIERAVGAVFIAFALMGILLTNSP